MWPYDDELNPQGVMGTRAMRPPGFDTSMPQLGMTLPQGRQTYPEPERGNNYAGMLLPLIMTQVGAALMQDPENRAKVLAGLPATMLAGMKMGRDDRKEELEKRKLDIWEKRYDPTVATSLEEIKQAGRERLMVMRDELQTKIQEMRDAGLDKRLSAQDERQLRLFEQQRAMLDARLSSQENLQSQRFGQQQDLQNQRLTSPRPSNDPNAAQRRDENQTFNLYKAYQKAETPEEKTYWGEELKKRGATETPGKPGWFGTSIGSTPPSLLPPGAGGGAPKPAGQANIGTRQVFNKRTGQMENVTEEQYRMIQKARGR